MPSVVRDEAPKVAEIKKSKSDLRAFFLFDTTSRFCYYQLKEQNDDAAFIH